MTCKVWLHFTGLVPLLLAGGCGLVSDSDDKVLFSTRSPVPLEYQYMYLAWEIDSAKPCYLIHRRSLTRSFSATGNQVSYVRSRCFYVVASHTGDPELCDKVRSVSTVFRSGADFNSARCRQQAGHRNSRFSGGLDVSEVVANMGYEPAEVDAFLVARQRFSSEEVARSYRLSKPGTYWGEVRRNLLHSREFFARLDTVSGFADAGAHEAMRHVAWSPRHIMQYTPPEERERGPSVIREPPGESPDADQ